LTAENAELLAGYAGHLQRLPLARSRSAWPGPASRSGRWPGWLPVTGRPPGGHVGPRYVRVYKRVVASSL